MRSVFATLFILMGACHAAAAETFVTVAPFVADADNRDAPSAEMIQEMVMSCLSSAGTLAVVERADMNAMTEEKSQSMTGFNQDTRTPMHLKGAQYVITGSIALLDDKWLLSLQANDPVTTQIIAAYSATLTPRFYGNGDELCESVVAPFTQVLLQHAKKPLDSNTLVDAQSEESTLLLKGLGYENNGDYAHAFPYFLKVLKRDPHSADAKYALAISYAKAGMPAFAQKEAAECFAEFPNHSKRKELEMLLQPPPQ